MSRRVNLPGAAELFRAAEPREGAQPIDENESSGLTAGQSSGRVRHDEKITIYVSREELFALEQARLTLRAKYGVSADRGRIVRETIAIALAEFAGSEAESALVARLTQQ